MMESVSCVNLEVWLVQRVLTVVHFSSRMLGNFSMNLVRGVRGRTDGYQLTL